MFNTTVIMHPPNVPSMMAPITTKLLNPFSSDFLCKPIIIDVDKSPANASPRRIKTAIRVNAKPIPKITRVATTKNRKPTKSMGEKSFVSSSEISLIEKFEMMIWLKENISACRENTGMKQQIRMNTNGQVLLEFNLIFRY